MNEPAIRPFPASRRWPMTTDAWRTLVDEPGAAVMGCRSGDRVEVMAPVGPRVVTVLSVE